MEMGITESKKLAMLEAALFMTEKPLWLDDLENILKIKKADIEPLLTKLDEKYKLPESGLELSRTGGFKLSVKPEFIISVSKLTRHSDMSRGLLRVLSIIVHNEPVTQSDLVKKVGNRVYEYTKELEELGFIRTEKKSRTKSIYTTKLFEEYFGVNKDKIQNKKETNEASDKKEEPKENTDQSTSQKKETSPSKDAPKKDPLPAKQEPVNPTAKPGK
jgi:segregation and condensation protein B